MGKEKTASKEERKQEKHKKKERRSEKDGVHKSKREKTEKETAEKGELVEANDTDLTIKSTHSLKAQKPNALSNKRNEETEVSVNVAPLIGALVPFANPLADDKIQKKVLKSVKKGNYRRSVIHL